MSESASDAPGESQGFAARQAHAVRRLLGAPDGWTEQTHVQAPSDAENAQANEGIGQHEVVVPPFRIAVAAELTAESLSATTAPIALLRAFAEMFSPGDPVNLVFAVDHEAGDADGAAAQALLGQLPPHKSLAGVSVESFAEVLALPTFAAVVPNGDARAFVADLAAAITAMHLLADTLRDPQKRQLLLQHQALLAVRRDEQMTLRLAAYREVELPRG